MPSYPPSPRFSRHGSSDRFVGVQPHEVEFLKTLNEGKEGRFQGEYLGTYLCDESSKCTASLVLLITFACTAFSLIHVQVSRERCIL